MFGSAADCREVKRKTMRPSICEDEICLGVTNIQKTRSHPMTDGQRRAMIAFLATHEVPSQAFIQYVCHVHQNDPSNQIWRTHVFDKLVEFVDVDETKDTNPRTLYEISFRAAKIDMYNHYRRSVVTKLAKGRPMSISELAVKYTRHVRTHSPR
jgi:hypothetical protein